MVDRVLAIFASGTSVRRLGRFAWQVTYHLSAVAMKQTRDIVRQFLVENFLFGAADKLGDDHESLVQTGIIDSTGVLELVAFVEDTCGIRVDDSEIVPENFDSIDRLVQFIAQRTPGGGGEVS